MFKDFTVFQVDGISIVGQLFLLDETAEYPLVCLCHGVPSGAPPDPSDGGYPELAGRICSQGYAVFTFNFRGTGNSGGNMDILGWTRDMSAVVDYLWDLNNVERSRFYLVGFSAGAAVSIFLAAKDERISGVVACASPAHFGLFLESGEPEEIINRYRTIGAIRDDDFPPSVQGWFDNLDQVTPTRYIAGVAPRPLLLVHGSQDETVPVTHAHELYDRAGMPKKMVIINGAGHKLRRNEKAIQAILDWLVSQCQANEPN